ncbi:hypothetical protein AB0F11_27445 [Streptomyces sp. NPDC032472]|uniref:hypothetical protein n=1 Tax=Streptomyces sp. NPDC032472 TaxID=3155018 RepID=UPI0033C32373
MRTVRTTDLSLARGTLEIRHRLVRHTVHLEGSTHQLGIDWLTSRHRRRRASTNPRLLVSQKTALGPDQPAVSIGLLQGVLPKGVSLEGLRRDRVLNDAFETANPLKLMRLFGITEQTAMRQAAAAHRERTAKLPKQPLRPQEERGTGGC